MITVPAFQGKSKNRKKLVETGRQSEGPVRRFPGSNDLDRRFLMRALEPGFTAFPEIHGITPLPGKLPDLSRNVKLWMDQHLRPIASCSECGDMPTAMHMLPFVLTPRS